MDIKELRIGNLVNCLSGFGNDVLAISALQGDETVQLFYGNETIGCFSIHSIKPIQLTKEVVTNFENLEEILSRNKNVFLKYVDEDWVWFNENPNIKKGFYLINYESEIIGNIIEFVHQFQNLIFALTGEELSLKSNLIER